MHGFSSIDSGIYNLTVTIEECDTTLSPSSGPGDEDDEDEQAGGDKNPHKDKDVKADRKKKSQKKHIKNNRHQDE